MSGWIAGAGVFWLLLALLVGWLQLLKALPFPAVPVMILALTAGVLLVCWTNPALRGWAKRLDIRALVLFHATRFVGFYFLWLHARGQLPAEFAVKAGWGDILVALLALGVAGLPIKGAAGWYRLFGWNLLGLLDILYVITTPLRLLRQGPAVMSDLNQLMNALTQLPLSLLPTFLVPLIIASHVLIFARLLRSRQHNFERI